MRWRHTALRASAADVARQFARARTRDVDQLLQTDGGAYVGWPGRGPPCVPWPEAGVSFAAEFW